MNNQGKKVFSVTLVTVFILATFSLVGCGDSELVKGITDAVKKSVGSEVAKKGEEIKKQIDQVINLGTGKGQKEDGQGDAKAGKKMSDKDSGKKSEEKD
jgi:hypothetical protein